jgi:hypothetical protein
LSLIYILSYYDMFWPYMAIIRFVWVLLKLFPCLLSFVTCLYSMLTFGVKKGRCLNDLEKYHI